MWRHVLRYFQEAIEIPIPRYFRGERNKALQDRAKMLSNILDVMGVADKPKVSVMYSILHDIHL